MTYIEPYITATISLLGIAYPLLLQVVARLDDKYSSMHIVILFHREKEYKCFKWSLIVSLVFIVLWSLLGWLNGCTTPIAEMLAAMPILFLVCSFFCFVNKILTYYTTTRFILYLKKKNYKVSENRRYLDAISDILLQFIREKRPDNFDLCKFWTENKLQDETLSEETCRDIWDILSCAVRYEQDDVIMEYWKTAHQYFMEHAEKINMELHYALGGHLINKHRYNCIQKLFAHTATMPPKYVLLPNIMRDIFTFYIDVWNENKYVPLSGRYPFPQESGWHAETVVKNAICSYMALLFLRQYSLQPHLITMQPLEYPAPPETQEKIHTWIDALPYFKKLVNEHIENDELMKIMGFQFITREWCTQNEKPYPLDFIDTFKKQCEHNAI